MVTTGNCLIGGDWVPGGGAVMSSISPADGGPIWTGSMAAPATVDAAVGAARAAGASWAALAVSERKNALERFVSLLNERADDLATLISDEVGKPRWEALTEVSAVAGKLAPTSRAYERRATEDRQAAGNAESVTFFRSLGVVAVLGPFNFPAHMPNGHIMPALLAGNTVVFKPSDLTPAVGEAYAAIWDESGLPAGVFNLVQGSAETGQSLIKHDDVAGVFFNGSRHTGVEISRSLADRPEKLLVLEMGGNNPLVVWDYTDLRAAVALAVQSCFVTSGQRCTAARRLIVKAEDTAFVEALSNSVRELRVGRPDAEPAPFMGPVISTSSAERLLSQQSDLLQLGAKALVEMEPAPEGLPFLRPGLVDMTPVVGVRDEEVFGPLLQLYRVEDFDEAVELTNASKYGLASGIVCVDRDRFSAFCARTRTGIVNWNQQLTGASGNAPFGGAGESGNHRPSGYTAVEYCSDAIGSLQSPSVQMPAQLPPGLTV